MKYFWGAFHDLIKMSYSLPVKQSFAQEPCVKQKNFMWPGKFIYFKHFKPNSREFWEFGNRFSKFLNLSTARLSSVKGQGLKCLMPLDPSTSITSTFQLPFGVFWYETKLINPSRILTSAGILVDLKQEFHIKLPDMWSCISWLKQSPKYENETNQTIWSVSVDWNELTRVPRSLIEATKGGGVFLLPRILNCLAVNQQLAYFFLGQSMRGIRRCRSGPNPSLAALAMSFFFFEIRVT